MSNAGSARIDRLNLAGLNYAENHGRRIDETSQARRVRKDESIAWSPGGGDPLALSDRLADHIEGAMVPKNAPKALHMLVKLPDCVPVATPAQAAAALGLMVDFANDTFGGNAVFAARIDRDERTLNNVDLFLAPRYEKRTARASKPAIAMTKHLKELRVKHGRDPKRPGPKADMAAQGQALQDELAAWLVGRGFEAVRGETKTTIGNDQRTPEEIGAQHDREAAEKALQEAQEARTAAETLARSTDARERAVSARETAVAAIAARQKVVAAELAAKSTKLERIARELAKVVQPIRDMAKRWTGARAVVRQAIGQEGEIAAEIDGSGEMDVLDSIVRQMGISR